MSDSRARQLAEFLARTPLAGDLEIVDQLGQGGMATVFRGRQPRLKRLVAVKFLGALDAESRLRFIREAKALADLEHPHIVRLYDANTAGQYPFLVMELVEGPTLRQVIEKGRLAPQKLALLARQVADALAYLHQSGIVHRDLKPANILIGPDFTAKVADFGLARCVEAGATLTSEGCMVGTPHYLAPEILGYEKATPASDVYAMGIVMYQALTGQFPFSADDMKRLLRAHLDAPVPDPRVIDPRIDGPIAELVMACMAKEPGERPADGAALRDALDLVLGATGERPAKRAEPPTVRITRSTWADLTGQARAGLALALFMALGLVGAAARATWQRRAVAPAFVEVSAAAPAPPPRPSAPSWSPEGVLAEPIEIRVPMARDIPLAPVASFSALPTDELAAMGELSDQLRHTTVCSGMTVFVATNPLPVEFGLVEPPGGSAQFQLDLKRTAHQALRVMIARRDALPIELKSSANRRRFTSDAVPVRRGLNKVFLVFLQESGERESVLVERVSIVLPAAAAAPADPPVAPLTPAAQELARSLEQARESERWDEVARIGELLTRAAPHYGPGWWRRGDAHRRLGRGDSRCGMEVLDEAVRRLPSNAWVWHDLGCAYRCQGWLPDAAHALAYAARILPREYWIWYDLAEVSRERGRYADALAQLDAAAKCPGAADFVGQTALLRADLLLAMKDREGALAALAKALAERPGDSGTRDGLARLQGGAASARIVTKGR